MVAPRLVHLLIAAASAAFASPGRAASPAAPLPAAEVKSAHAAFDPADCGLCHERGDPTDPGKVAGAVNELCFGCHAEVKELLSRKVAHWPATDSCTTCHNPHGGRHEKLLVDETVALCTSCHADVGEEVAAAKVKHGAVTTGKRCAACHNPHGSDADRLLVASPFELCLGCHGTEGLRSADGRPLANMRAWLAENPEWHAPVRAKDCTACHRPHGGPSSRLLSAAYPETFYATYSKAIYRLCFGCHDARAFGEPETLTLTSFRNGTKNLHFVHVARADRGRTCRACHEVHASRQPHHLREGVPYGPKGWVLRLNYEKTSTGGTCAKVCHETRSYDNRPIPSE